MSLFDLFGRKHQDDKPAPDKPEKKETKAETPTAPDGTVSVARFDKEGFDALLESLAGQRHVVVGVFGATHAGKTITISALERCMTGERSFGNLWLQISAVENPVRYAQVRYKGCAYLFVDCPGDPGSEEDLRAMADTAAHMDAAVVVVPVDDGVQPGTARHVELIRATGVKNVAVFLNKCDLAEDPEAVDLLENGVRAVLEELGLTFRGGPVPFLRGAALPAFQDSDSYFASVLLELAETVEACAHEE